MTKYAEGTSVPADRSRSEIERILTRYGAVAFAYGWEDDKARVAFQAAGRSIRFEIKMPPLEDFARTPGGRRWRSQEQMAVERDKAMRQRWRALALVIKAKLEAVESGISTFESEFLANVVLPDGSTVGEYAAPQIALAYEEGEMPKLLGPGR